MNIAFKDSPYPLSVNGLLALCMATDGISTTWDAILPTPEDISESIPFNWHASLQALLPPGAATLVSAHQKKIAQDRSAVTVKFPIVDYKSFVYYWFLVSTRTFYFTAPTPKGKKAKKEPLDHDDCISLAPFADCFNHTSQGTCAVTFSDAGYALRTISAITKGDEMSISYGNHSNDFLLAEYGFILSSEDNTWDETPIDFLILPLFSETQKQTLKDASFLGKYVLDKDGVCYRTQVALRLLCMSEGKWEKLVANGLEGSEKSQKDVDAILVKHLAPYLEVIDDSLKRIEGSADGLESQRDTLKRRWEQIRTLFSDCLEGK